MATSLRNIKTRAVRRSLRLNPGDDSGVDHSVRDDLKIDLLPARHRMLPEFRKTHVFDHKVAKKICYKKEGQREAEEKARLEWEANERVQKVEARKLQEEQDRKRQDEENARMAQVALRRNLEEYIESHGLEEGAHLLKGCYEAGLLHGMKTFTLTYGKIRTAKSYLLIEIPQKEWENPVDKKPREHVKKTELDTPQEDVVMAELDTVPEDVDMAGQPLFEDSFDSSDSVDTDSEERFYISSLGENPHKTWSQLSNGIKFTLFEELRKTRLDDAAILDLELTIQDKEDYEEIWTEELIRASNEKMRDQDFENWLEGLRLPISIEQYVSYFDNSDGIPPALDSIITRKEVEDGMSFLKGINLPSRWLMDHWNEMKPGGKPTPPAFEGYFTPLEIDDGNNVAGNRSKNLMELDRDQMSKGELEARLAAGGELSPRAETGRVIYDDEDDPRWKTTPKVEPVQLPNSRYGKRPRPETPSGETPSRSTKRPRRDSLDSEARQHLIDTGLRFSQIANSPSVRKHRTPSVAPSESSLSEPELHSSSSYVLTPTPAHQVAQSSPSRMLSSSGGLQHVPSSPPVPPTTIHSTPSKLNRNETWFSGESRTSTPGSFADPARGASLERRSGKMSDMIIRKDSSGNVVQQLMNDIPDKIIRKGPDGKAVTTILEPWMNRGSSQTPTKSAPSVPRTSVSVKDRIVAIDRQSASPGNSPSPSLPSRLQGSSGTAPNARILSETNLGRPRTFPPPRAFSSSPRDFRSRSPVPSSPAPIQARSPLSGKIARRGEVHFDDLNKVLPQHGKDLSPMPNQQIDHNILHGRTEHRGEVETQVVNNVSHSQADQDLARSSAPGLSSPMNNSPSEHPGARQMPQLSPTRNVYYTAGLARIQTAIGSTRQPEYQNATAHFLAGAPPANNDYVDSNARGMRFLAHFLNLLVNSLGFRKSFEASAAVLGIPILGVKNGAATNEHLLDKAKHLIQLGGFDQKIKDWDSRPINDDESYVYFQRLLLLTQTRRRVVWVSDEDLVFDFVRYLNGRMATDESFRKKYYHAAEDLLIKTDPRCPDYETRRVAQNCLYLRTNYAQHMAKFVRALGEPGGTAEALRSLEWLDDVNEKSVSPKVLERVLAQIALSVSTSSEKEKCRCMQRASLLGLVKPNNGGLRRNYPMVVRSLLKVNPGLCKQIVQVWCQSEPEDVESHENVRKFLDEEIARLDCLRREEQAAIEALQHVTAFVKARLSYWDRTYMEETLDLEARHNYIMETRAFGLDTSGGLRVDGGSNEQISVVSKEEGGVHARPAFAAEGLARTSSIQYQHSYSTSLPPRDAKAIAQWLFQNKPETAKDIARISSQARSNDQEASSGQMDEAMSMINKALLKIRTDETTTQLVNFFEYFSNCFLDGSDDYQIKWAPLIGICSFLLRDEDGTVYSYEIQASWLILHKPRVAQLLAQMSSMFADPDQRPLAYKKLHTLVHSQILEVTASMERYLDGLAQRCWSMDDELADKWGPIITRNGLICFEGPVAEAVNMVAEALVDDDWILAEVVDFSQRKIEMARAEGDEDAALAEEAQIDNLLYEKLICLYGGEAEIDGGPDKEGTGVMNDVVDLLDAGHDSQSAIDGLGEGLEMIPGHGDLSSKQQHEVSDA